VFLLCSAFEPSLDPVLRRGHGLLGVLALSGYQFASEGAALGVIALVRRETLSDYGFTRVSLSRSVAMALALTCLNDLALSWHTRALVWLPFGRHAAARMAMRSDIFTAALGIVLTITVWGVVESFFGVFFARKVNAIVRHSGRGWMAPGALAFGLFNGMIHLAIGQGMSGFAASFASGYVIGVIPALTGNAWGSAVFQSLTNAIGRL
jgi:hypothetical protein